jgi:MFS family permease
MYMYTLSPHPIPSAFAINAWAIFCSIILFFPVAGHWSDIFGRRRVMTIGGVIFGLGAPIGLRIISQGVPWWAFGAQLFMGTALSLWCAPMAAWLAESFAPQTRLTNVAVGYNVGVGLFSGVAPAAATYCVDVWGFESPGYLLFGAVSLIGLMGLWVVAPAPSPRKGEHEETRPLIVLAEE